MSDQERLTIPESLRDQLDSYRRHVWTIKMIEAVAVAAVGMLTAFVVVYGLDRLFDTPAPVRWIVFAGVVAAIGCVPLFGYRWIWRHRQLEALAKLIGRRLPLLGDQLLGAIELVRHPEERDRSPVLAAAAVQQVAAETQRRDLREARPAARYRWWSVAALTLAGAAGLLSAIYPAASISAWQRALLPWRETPRFTFTQVEPLPETLVVARGEPFQLPVRLTEASLWHPGDATAQLAANLPVTATSEVDAYVFELPPVLEPATLHLRVGDLSKSIQVEPKLRPELKTLAAEVTLPAYLNRSAPLEEEIRGGTLTVVKGSQAKVSATATRGLERVRINGTAVGFQDDRFAQGTGVLEESQSWKIDWQDRFGLPGHEPLELSLEARDDEAPVVSSEGLPRNNVVLDSELLSFTLKSSDDFGVRRVGLHWSQMSQDGQPSDVTGERTLAAGGPEETELVAQGAFSAKSMEIPPGPLQVRLWAEDYLPERGRVYSAPHTVYVLTPEQHAIWMAEQLNQWHRRALEMRDRERQLYAENKRLRELPADQQSDAEVQRQLRKQAAAERSGGRQLAKLTEAGEMLVKQASRNPEIGVGHLESWAEMLQVLKDISQNRMPSVADLLKQGSEQPQLASTQPPKPNGPQVGNVRNTAGGGKPVEMEPDQHPNRPTVPTIADVESNQQPANPTPEGQEAEKKLPSTPKFGLPQTTLVGPGSQEPTPPKPPGDAVQEAVKQQQDLLAEFEKIADELNQILGNLEGSTLVKRLKAASREQYKIGGELTDGLSETFGRKKVAKDSPPHETLVSLSEVEAASALKVSRIMDDMEAYFERRRLSRFQHILDEMKEVNILGSLRELSEDLKQDQAISVAQCDYWSDSLDRWAEDLVDPACQGSCPGGKSPASLPPSLVLEVMQILEAEINLREETRVAQQAREAVAARQHEAEAERLAKVQSGLGERLAVVIEKIVDLPEGRKHFAKDLQLLEGIVPVIREATSILQRGETGAPAIAAETEVIERLLESKRINPGGGGGGGATPGGGGGGTTSDSALALMGRGVNAKEVREERPVEQSVGRGGPALPEEFRAGLDQYFNQLEQVQ